MHIALATDGNIANGRQVAGSIIAAITISILAGIFLVIYISVALTVIILHYRYYWQIRDYIIEIKIKNDITSIIQALEVFEVMNIYNTI